MKEAGICRCRPTPWLAVVALITVVVGGCVQPGTSGSDPAALRSHDDMVKLVRDIKAYEKRIGFAETKNFLRFSAETEAFPFCGHVSRFYLPYSYEDPAIHWLDSVTEEECLAFRENADVYFGTSEAVGERETPITVSMRAAPLDRFLYLVIHEDCHEQFDLPYGIEEPLCNVIAHEAVAVYGERAFAAMRVEYRALRRYAREESRRYRMARASYEQLAVLYARYERKEISPQLLLRAREPIFRRAERALAWEEGSMNNAAIANVMTYSRHYPFLESVFHGFRNDIARMVAFFRRVDATKPSLAEVMNRNGLATENGVGAIRAYETAVIETIERMLER